MNPTNMTEDQKAKLRACKSADELKSLAEDQGIVLSDDQLEAVSGGECYHCDDLVSLPKVYD